MHTCLLRATARPLVQVKAARQWQVVQVKMMLVSGKLSSQPFSPAHTVASLEQDEMNEAALFSVHQLPEQTKPRVVTLEETAGLLSRHTPYFLTLINIYSD
jgi:hypothetical protein